MPSPDLMSPAPAPLVIWPPMVETLSGLVTLIVRAAAPRFTTPLRVTPLTASGPPKVKLPATLTLFETVWTAVPLWRVVFAPMVRVPRPSGPVLVETSGLPAVLGVLLAARMRAPPLRARPVVQLLL